MLYSPSSWDGCGVYPQLSQEADKHQQVVVAVLIVKCYYFQEVERLEHLIEKQDIIIQSLMGNQEEGEGNIIF